MPGDPYKLSYREVFDTWQFERYISIMVDDDVCLECAL